MKIPGKIIAIFAVLAFLWLMAVTASPIRPRRIEKFTACDVGSISSWEAGKTADRVIQSYQSSRETSANRIEFIYPTPPRQPEFWCRFPIPEMILYRAITLNATYQLNQSAYLGIGLRRVGQGPGLQQVQVDEGSINKPVTSTWLLNRFDEPKLNWLSGPYEGVTFRISGFDPGKELKLTIYQVYFE